MRGRRMLPIGPVLKALRGELGMTQEDVALRACVSRQQLSAFESGTRRPSIEMLVLLAKALGVEPAELMQRAVDLQRQRKSSKEAVGG